MKKLLSVRVFFLGIVLSGTFYLGLPALAEVNKPPCECRNVTADYKGIWNEGSCLYVACK